MAAGRTHDLINLSVLPVAVYYLRPENAPSFIAGYFIGTFFLSPDNDIFHSKPNKRWKILRFIWYPYTKLFSHRGISHLPVLGILTKLIYLVIVFSLISAIILIPLYFYKPDLIPEIDTNPQSLKEYLLHPFTVSFFFGLILSEIVHVITDIIYSAIKKLKVL
ncbi:metal-binding protein [Persephonella sp. IF05-L8]|uniref:DUF2227 family putative metal-binding protein n=1 Tax=Persephonella sp. IF05-L8 TaxID=1158338 RepID=UPI0004982FEC